MSGMNKKERMRIARDVLNYGHISYKHGIFLTLFKLHAINVQEFKELELLAEDEEISVKFSTNHCLVYRQFPGQRRRVVEIRILLPNFEHEAES